MTILISALAFIVLLTLLIIIHELGHYLSALFFKVEVEEFGFGLPPKATTLFRSGKTNFTLNWVPFGGFVRLKGENEIDLEKRYSAGSFAKASIFARLVILFGGVAMNFVLAFVLLTFGFSVGRWVPNFYQTIEQMEAAAQAGEITLKTGVYVNDVLAGSPAEKAGMRKDSVIVAVDGVYVEKPEQLIQLQQGKSSVTYDIRPTRKAPVEQVVIRLQDGKSGVSISAYAAELSAPQRSVGRAVMLALEETRFMTEQTVIGMGNLVRSLVTQGHVPEGITGIVGIAVLTHSSVQEGFMTYLRLVALLSLSLAILNVLPLPALDGGRILFVLCEMVLRRPLNQQFELMVNAVGFFLLIGLIVIITFNDVIHLF
jgi:regulator of sigma E protease